MPPTHRIHTAFGAIFLALALLWGGWAYAQQAGTQQQATPQVRLSMEDVSFINSMEDSLFSSRFDQEPVQSRLGRLELTLFGETRNAMPIPERLRWLREALKKVQPIRQQGMGVPPPQQQMPPQAAPAPLANESNYPAVTALEQKVFGRTFEDTGEDITQRLERVEMATFQTPQRGALVDRVENLQLLVFGDNRPRAVSSVNTNLPAANGGVQPLSRNVLYDPSYIPANQADMMAATSQLEHQLFKQSFPSEPLPQRLDRLEGKLFNGTSPEMTEEDRLQRIIAVAAAGGDRPGPAAVGGGSGGKGGAMDVILPIVLTVLFGLL